jgi:uncharacterized damage-inducible protein DinB
MTNASLLSKMFELSYGALFRNLEGITHEESLISPEPAGNCLNWVLGHILATRNRLLPLVGVEPIWPRENAFLYSGRDEAQWSLARAFHLDAIKTDLARSQQQLLGAFDALPESALASPAESGGALGDVIGFFHFHESYHGGQIALLRRIVGRPGVIRPPTPRRASIPG